MRIVAGCLSFVLAVVSNAAQAQWGFDLDDGREWAVSISLARVEQQLDGDMLWGGAGLGNTTLDVENTLDLDDSEEFAGWISFQPGAKTLLRVGYIPFDFSGQSVLTATEIVNGVTYAIGDTVDTAFQFDRYELAFGYKFRLGERLIVAPMLELDVFDGFLDTIDLNVPGSAVSDEFIVPVPLAGLRIEFYPLARLGLFAEGKGFKAGNWGDLAEATIVDAEVGAYLHLSKNLVLTAAYGLTDFRFDVSDTEVDLEMSGLSVSLDLRF